MFHLPLAFRPLAAAPGEVVVTLPAADIGVAAGAPSAFAGTSATLPAADIVLGGAPPGLFEGIMVTLPAADVALGAAVPSLAAGTSVTLARTIAIGARFGALAERPLGAAPLPAGAIALPLVMEIAATPPAPFQGAMITLEHTRTLPAHFGMPGEWPLGGAPIAARTTQGPAAIELFARPPDGFARSRRVRAQMLTN
jgi:hypothetical protein